MDNCNAGIWKTSRITLCAGLALFCVGAPHAIASHNSADREIEFNFAPGDLAFALKSFSEQSGISVIFDNRLVRGHRIPALSGAYTASEAMAGLLAGAGLHHKRINDHTWAIIPGPATRDAGAEAAPIALDDGATLASEYDEIIVTASYRTPNHYAGTRALYTLDGEQMRLNGALNIAEPIYELPATVASVSSANTALLLSSGGLNLADLRGLGAERTLVLVNGRRYIRTSGGNGTTLGVDLNSIPAPFVERIEVVNQGAGAAIGLEAVAGAINIVTRDDIDGIVLTADGGVSEIGDAAEYSFSLLAGKRFADDRARIAAGVTLASEPSLLVQQRPRISSPYGFGLNGRTSTINDGVFASGFGGSVFTPTGALAGAVMQAGAVRLFPSGERQVFASDGQSFESFEGRLDQLYNWTTDFAALPEIERLIGYATAAYEFSPSHTAYAELHIAKTDVATQVASSPISARSGRNLFYGDAILVPANHPFAPAGLQATVESIAGGPVSGFLLERRFVELGPRRREIDRRTFQMAGGVEGVLRGEWGYDIYYQFGRNRTLDRALGLADAARLETALDPGACALVSGCSPLNIFSSASITPAQADFIAASPSERQIETREQIGQAKISGPIFTNRGEQGYVTAGIEYRRERLEDMPLISDGAPALGDFFIPGAVGKVAHTEAFINTTLPILVDAPWARFLEIGGAYRLTIRRGAGEFSNFSSNARWSPVDGVEFYAHVFHGGRSPNVVELFSAGPNINQLFFDPCDTSWGALSGVIADNCSTTGPLGVGAGFTQGNALTFVEESGNPTLREERVDSRLFGASADIHALIPSTPGILKISADWRRHRVTKAPGGVGVQDILMQCYESEGLSNLYCGVNPATGNLFIQRDILTQQILEVESTLINDAMLHTSGLDARLQYMAEFDGVPLADMFALDILYTYIHRIRSRELTDDAETIREGLIEFPRHQIHATASLGADALKTVWTVRRRGAAASNLSIDNPAFRAPAVTYVDTSVQWRAGNHAIIYAGVENLFDRQIPIVANAPNGYFFEHYDPIGRRFFAGLKAEF